MENIDISIGEVLITGVKFVLLNVPFFMTGFNAYAHFKIMKSIEKVPIKFCKFPRSISKFENTTVSKLGLNEEEAQCVDEFLDVIRSLRHVNEALFFNNMHSYAIKEARLNFLRRKVLGEYDIDEKKISYDGKCRDAIFHELLHMASTRVFGNNCFCGFEEIEFDEDGDVLYCIGTGLMEGYTQLLTQRYFKKNGACTRTYPLFVHITSYIEFLVGREKMENMYFRTDLEGLVSSLEKYLPRDLIIKLLKDIDYIYCAIYDKKCFATKLLATKAYQRVLRLISLMLKKKIVLDGGEKNVDTEAVFYSLGNYKMTRGFKCAASRETRDVINELRRRAYEKDKEVVNYAR